MTLHLPPHGQELLEAALARGVGRSPEDVVERALEAASGMERTLSSDELERRRQAVAHMIALREEYHLTWLAQQILPLERTYHLSAYDFKRAHRRPVRAEDTAE